MKKIYFFLMLLLAANVVWGQIAVTPGTGFNLDGQGAGIYATRPTGADFSSGTTEQVLQIVTKTNTGAAIDFDGDGNREIVVQTAGINAGAATQTHLYILEANANNDFRQRSTIIIPQGTNNGAPGLMRGVDVGNVDGDAAVEIVAISGNGTNSFMTIYDINTSTFAFTELINKAVFGAGGLFTTSGTTNQLRIISNKNGGSNNDIILSNATGTAAASQLFAVEYTGAAIAFVNTTAANSGVLVNSGMIAFDHGNMGDASDEELVMVTESATVPLAIQEYVTSATAPFGTIKTITTNWTGTTTGSMTTVTIGDIDDDGDLDAVANDYNGKQLKAIRRTGANTYTSETILGSALAANSPATELSDIDIDGKLEIIYANGTSVVYREHDGTANDFTSARWGAETTLMSGLGTGTANAVSFVGGSSTTLDNDYNFDIVVGRSVQVIGQSDLDDDELFFLEADRLFTSGTITAGNYDNVEIQTGTVTLGGTSTINGTLTLTSGKLALGGNNISAVTVTGGSSSNYVVTDGAGTLTINNVGSTAVTFPVGPSASLYHPATITNNGTVDNFSVKVSSTDPACSPSAKSVNATWDIAEALAGGSDCDLTLDFTGATTGGSLTASGAQIVHCSGTTADYHNGSVTGTVATGTGFTTFSPFGVTSDPLTLPVSLLSFAGQKEGSVNKLRWSTVTEINNLGFEVQRSVDGINYTAIGFVNSLAPGGNSNSQLNYSFTDNNPVSNKQYYRLRQIDNDNRSKFSNIVLIKGDKPVVLTIDGVFPNPASSTVNVIVATPYRDRVTLVVTDISGRTVAQKVVNVETGSNTIPVGISQLTNGSYLVKLVCVANPIAIGCEMAIGRFVKQ